MKIVYMTYGIHYSGGMERVLSVKANYLADVLGHEVYIVITDGKGRIPFFKFSDKIRIIDLGINYRDLSQVNLLKKVIPYLKKIITHRKKLSQLLYEIKADICISMFQYEAVILHGITDGSKKIIESHFCRIVDLLKNKNNRGISKIIGNYLYRRNSKIADKYDCLVTLTYDDLLRYPDVKPKTCIHNPLTTNILHPHIHKFTHDASAINISSEDNKRVVLAVGRVSYQKGFDNLVEIWNTLEKSYPNWELHIYGSQEDTEFFTKVSNRIKELKLDNIFLFPPTDNIEAIYQNSDILVVTSNYEGFNLSITEGMSFKLPVVSFNCPCGPSEIIQDKINGFLIEPGDFTCFAKALRLLMTDEELRVRMGRDAYQRSLDYSISQIMGKWVALFNNLLNNK